MTKVEIMAHTRLEVFVIRPSSFILHSSFFIRHSNHVRPG